MDLYKEELMEHFKHPCNNKKVERPNFSSGEDNPSCGDSILIEGVIENGKIVEIGFTGKGCVISLATASMLTEKCKGQEVKSVLNFSKDDILTMVSLKLGPNRLKCALLSLEALQKGLRAYEKR